MYYVVGGEYVDTTWKELDLDTYELHGAFQTYEEAYDVWRTRTWKFVDHCYYKFSIIKPEEIWKYYFLLKKHRERKKIK